MITMSRSPVFHPELKLWSIHDYEIERRPGYFTKYTFSKPLAWARRRLGAQDIIHEIYCGQISKLLVLGCVNAWPGLTRNQISARLPWPEIVPEVAHGRHRMQRNRIGMHLFALARDGMIASESNGWQITKDGVAMLADAQARLLELPRRRATARLLPRAA